MIFKMGVEWSNLEVVVDNLACSIVEFIYYRQMFIDGGSLYGFGEVWRGLDGFLQQHCGPKDGSILVASDFDDM